MNTMRKIAIAALVVVATFVVSASSAGAKPVAVKAPVAAIKTVTPSAAKLGPNDPCQHVAVRGWTCFGGDPLFPGGLRKIAADRGISLRQAFVYAMTSSRARTAMTYARRTAQQRLAFLRQVRMGNFHRCALKYGEFFPFMSYSANGANVDVNVSFRDPRYKNVNAPSFCVDVPEYGPNGNIVGYKHYKVPWLCVNFGVKRPTKVPYKSTLPPAPKPKPKPRPTPQPKPVPPAKAPIVIGKQCVDPNNTAEVCPTNTFMFAVSADGNSSTVAYNPSPGENGMVAGQCTPGSTVVVAEQPMPGWELIFPTNPVQVLTCSPKGVLAVFKNRETHSPTETPPTTTSKKPPPKTTTQTTTTTPKPAGCTDGSPPPCPPPLP